MRQEKEKAKREQEKKERILREIKFKETIDAQSGQKSNPIEALGVCMECGKSTRVYCVCPKKNKGKRKAGRSDADELAALMDA